MKNLSLMFIAVIVILGCESSPKTLDWNKTASEQKFKVGDTIVVEGITTNIVNYKDTKGSVTEGSTKEALFVSPADSYRIQWNEEISIPLFNPEQPDVMGNPNVPLGIVICTIYNPSHNKDLQVLYEMYPNLVVQETRKDALSRFFSPYQFKLERVHPHISHRFRFIGTIHSIGRKIIGGVSLSSVDIEVSDITVIGSEQLNKLESWRTDESIQSSWANVEEFKKEVQEDIKRLEEEKKRIAEEMENLLKEQNR